MPKMVIDLNPDQHTKLSKQKSLDGYGDASWKEWFLSKANPRFIMTEMDGIGLGIRTMRQMWGNNIGHNLAYIRRKGVKTLRDLAQTEWKGSAIMVGAGPSVDLHNHLDVIKESGYEGTIVASDRMLPLLLKKGIVPQHVLTVDGSELIIPFYRNKLFRKHVKDIKVGLHFTANPKLVRYLYRIKANVYWYIIQTENRPTEDTEVMQSIYLTQSQHNPSGLQSLLGGGNVGVTAWVFSWVVLKKNPVMLVGMDMGYPEGTQLDKTYYFSTFFKYLKSHGMDGQQSALQCTKNYIKEYNPVWKSWATTDTVFRGYRDILYSLFEGVPPQIATINCFTPDTIIMNAIPSAISTNPISVLSHDGQNHLVTKFYQQNYAGPLIEMAVWGLPHTRCTPDHPFLIVRPATASRRHSFRRKKVCNPVWMAASDIRVNDYLVSLNTDLHDNLRTVPTLNSRGRKPFPSQVNLTPEVLWLIGLYAADGGMFDKNSGQIAIEPDNSPKIDKIQEVLKTAFNIETSVDDTRINIHSASFMDTFRNWCGSNCYEKHLPIFALSSQHTIAGVLDGDGYNTPKYNVISTVSSSLAYQVRQSLLSLGEYPYLRLRQRAQRKGQYPNAHPIFEIEWGSGSWHYTRRIGQYYLLPVREITSQHYTGFVFNLAVAQTETYLANGVIVHNCTEGGTLNHPKLHPMKLEEALKKYRV